MKTNILILSEITTSDGHVVVYKTGCYLTVYLCDICNGQIHYKDSVGQGTTIPDLPEVKRVRETQKNISLVEENRLQ